MCHESLNHTFSIISLRKIASYFLVFSMKNNITRREVLQAGLAGNVLIIAPVISADSPAEHRKPAWDYIVMLNEQAKPYFGKAKSGCTADGFEYRNHGRNLQVKTDGGLVTLNHEYPFRKLFTDVDPISVVLEIPFGRKELFKRGLVIQHQLGGYPEETARYTMRKEGEDLRLFSVYFSSGNDDFVVYSDSRGWKSSSAGTNRFKERHPDSFQGSRFLRYSRREWTA